MAAITAVPDGNLSVNATVLSGRNHKNCTKLFEVLPLLVVSVLLAQTAALAGLLEIPVAEQVPETTVKNWGAVAAVTASVNAVWAPKPEDWPIAVSVKVLPISIVCGANCMKIKLPCSSAVATNAGSAYSSGRSWRVSATSSLG